MYFDWKNAASVDTLRTMVALDIPYPDIATKLGTSVGSICAKVHRLGIGKGPRAPNSRSFLRPVGRAFESDPDHERVMARQAAEEITYAGRTTPLEDCDDCGCRYVIGDPSKRQVCGQPRTRGAYCVDHAKVCFSAPSRIRARATLHSNGGCPALSRQANRFIPVSTGRLFSVDPRTFEVIDGRREAGDAGLYSSSA